MSCGSAPNSFFLHGGASWNPPLAENLAVGHNHLISLTGQNLALTTVVPTARPSVEET